MKKNILPINLIDTLNTELIVCSGNLSTEEKNQLMYQFVEGNILSGMKVIMHNQAVLKSIMINHLKEK